jgi:hypothetical protein
MSHGLPPSAIVRDLMPSTAATRFALLIAIPIPR